MSIAAPDDGSQPPWSSGQAFNTPDAREREIAIIMSKMIEYGFFTSDRAPICLLREAFFLTRDGHYRGGECPAKMTYDDLYTHLDSNYSAEELGGMSVYDGLKAVIAVADVKRKGKELFASPRTNSPCIAGLVEQCHAAFVFVPMPDPPFPSTTSLSSTSEK